MKATLTVLGSGTSMGVPTIGCTCAVCNSADPRDRRTRPSVLIEYAGKVVLIDTTPDFREQAIREKVARAAAVLYTHSHADYILGNRDLCAPSYYRELKIVSYARPEAPDHIRNMSGYFFNGVYTCGGLPGLDCNLI